MLLAVALVAAVTAPACHQGQFRGTGAPCASNGDCVSGFVCVQQKCQIAGPGPIQMTQDGGDADTLQATPTDAADADAGTDVDVNVNVDVAQPDVLADGLPADLAEEGGGDAPFDGDASDSPGLKPPYPPRPCDLSQPFQPPMLIMDNSQSVFGTHDVTPRLSHDELTLYFSSNRSGSYLIHSATRSHRTDPFSMPMPLANLAGGINQAPTVTADGLTMYFESDRNQMYALQKSTRADLASDWSGPAQVYSISTPDTDLGDGGPSVSPDGKVIYFHSARSGNLNIFRAELSGAGFGTAFPVAGISTTFDEARPVFSEDELTLFYASNRPEGGAKGAWDIWMTKRKSKEDAFETPVNVSELNTKQFEDPGWLSADQCDLYFGRGGVDMDNRLYVAHRPPKPAADGGL
jgi:hypothetical protein